MAAKPFKEELQQLVVCSDEFTIIFGMILLFCMYIFNDDEYKKTMLSYGIIGVIAASLAKNVVIIVYLNVTKSYKKLRSLIHRKLRIKKLK